jgi:hypothetical protein
MKAYAVIGLAVLLVAAGASQARAHGGGGGGITENDVCSVEKGHQLVHFSAYQHVAAEAASQFAKIKELKGKDLKRYVDSLKEEFQSFCRDIPSTGKVTLTFDLISDTLRTTPMAIRVVEVTNGGESGTVMEIPQQAYPSGVVRAEAEFTKAGKYRAIVELQEHHADRSPPGATAEAASRSHDGAVAVVSQKHGTAGEEEAYHAYDSSFSFPFTVGLKTARVVGGASSIMSPAVLVMTIAGMGIGAVLYVRRRKNVA